LGCQGHIDKFLLIAGCSGIACRNLLEMSTAYSARKLLDPSAKKQRVKLVSSKVHRPRRPQCETVNSSGRKTGGRKVEFKEDEMAPAPRKETVHCTKIPVGEVRPPRSRTQVKHDPTMLGHHPQPQVTSQRKKIPDCQKQAQTHWKPRHPRTPRSETTPKLSRTQVIAEVPKQLSRIQREQPTKSSSTPAQNGTTSREVAARNHEPMCIPLRHNYPRNTTSRVLCPRPTTKRPVASCATPENRYGTRNIKPGSKFAMFHTDRRALRTCVYSCVLLFLSHSGSTVNEELNGSLRNNNFSLRSRVILSLLVSS